VALRYVPHREAELMLEARPTDAMRAAWHPEYPLADTLEGLTWLFAAWQEMGGLDPASPWWTYQLMVDGQAVGDIGFHGPPDPGGRLTIGYQVVPAAQRQGIATAACGQLVALAWAAGARNLRAHVDPGNRASREVLVRNGFVSADGRSFSLDRP
jgi:RimJ/RimL family protein N-acetyltransferase